MLERLSRRATSRRGETCRDRIEPEENTGESPPSGAPAGESSCWLVDSDARRTGVSIEAIDGGTHVGTPSIVGEDSPFDKVSRAPEPPDRARFISDADMSVEARFTPVRRSR